MKPKYGSRSLFSALVGAGLYVTSAGAYGSELDQLEKKCFKAFAGIQESTMQLKPIEGPCKELLELAERSNDQFRVFLGRLTLGFALVFQGRQDEGVSLWREALASLKSSLGLSLDDLIAAENSKKEVSGLQYLLTEMLRSEARYADAERLHRHALAIEETTLGSSHQEVGMRLLNLAGVLAPQDRHAEAARVLERASSILEKSLGRDHEIVMVALSFQALEYDSLGRYGDEEVLLKRILAVQESKHGPTHSLVAKSITNLAALMQTMGRGREAIPLYRRALAIEEGFLGLESPEVANSLDTLADVYMAQEQYPEAEQIYSRALAIREKSFGKSSLNVVNSLINLGRLQEAQQNFPSAERFYRQALGVQEKLLGLNHPDLGHTLFWLGSNLQAQGRNVDAEHIYIRSLRLAEVALGPDSEQASLTIGSLAGLYEAQQQYSKAEPLLRRSLAIAEKLYDTEHPKVAFRVSTLASNLDNQGRHDDAEPLYLRAVEIYRKSLEEDHPDLASALSALSTFYRSQGKIQKALEATWESAQIYGRRIVSGTVDTPDKYASVEFSKYIRLLFSLESWDGLQTDNAFQTSQLLGNSGTGAALAKMAARFASGSDELAILVRTLQDAIDRRNRGDDDLIKAAMLPSDKRDVARERKLRAEMAELKKHIESLSLELTSRFPEYAQLTSPAPLTGSETSKLLGPEEALLVYTFVYEQLTLWVVRSDSGILIPLNSNRATLTEQVKRIRTQVDTGGTGQLENVDVPLLHELYQSVFAPAIPHLAGVKNLMLVPAGALQSLPFGMLVASKPKKIESDEDYRAVDWLIKHYAMSVLPSVSSIRAFRVFAKPGVAQEPFIGFGDPLLTDEPGITRAKRAKAKVKVAGLFRNLAVSGGGPQQMEIADVKVIKQQARLPESADEIKAMAMIMKAGGDSTWLQERATETNVKNLDLSKYRMIAFATHGILAGKEGMGMEAGLLLTPPETGTIEDDGYLAAGEIAKLKLNADWVLLSACNTAAADGSPGAEGLSGMAKAFFYAGTRSLLVSHWPVDSVATVALTTAMLREYEVNPGQGKAEAHRKSMLALMNTPDHPEFAHPIFWAPFVVVGEGGR